MQITQHANPAPPRRQRKKDKAAPAKEKTTAAAAPAPVLPPETPAFVGFATGSNKPEAPAVAAQGYASARGVVSVR